MNKMILAAIVGAVAGAAVTFFVLKKKTDKVIVSLRSVKEEANCVEIANSNHGGGHIHAAGFTLK